MQRQIAMLLVEDDPNASEIIYSMLEMFFPQARIYSAADGKQGLDTFRAHRPDIVITDINMPDMDGVQMLDQIYALKPDARVIVITAHSDRKNLDRINSVCAGALMVPKPIDFEFLFKSAKRCIASLPTLDEQRI
jgi:DNA-binding NarL/FixJ family response regulator